MEAIGTFGNEGRNPIYGPGQYNLDLSFFKTTRIKERAALEFRWEMFNALNHANLGNPNTDLQFVGIRPHRHGNRSTHYASRNEADLLIGASR